MRSKFTSKPQFRGAAVCPYRRNRPLFCGQSYHIATPHDGPTVVVTHHAPSAKSVGVPITAADAAFASDLEETVLRHRPSLWVHGHIRWHSDYVFGDTRVSANPRGYQGDEWGEKSGFIEDFVVDVQ